MNDIESNNQFKHEEDTEKIHEGDTENIHEDTENILTENDNDKHEIKDLIVR